MTEIKKYLSADQTLRIASMISTDLLNELPARAALSPLAKTITGRAMTAAALMAAQLKEGQIVGLHFQGAGPLGSVFAESAYEGASRAYCERRDADLPTGVRDLGLGLGQGHLAVIRSMPGQKEPYRGTVPLLTGSVAEDVAYYLNQSQQIPAIVSLSLIPAEDDFELGGGYILELMPGASEATIETLEKLQSQMPSMTRQIEQGHTAADLIDPILNSFAFDEIEHPHRAYHRCICSAERMQRALKMLGELSLRDILKKAEQNEATCEFCGQTYSISLDVVQSVLDELIQDRNPGD